MLCKRMLSAVESQFILTEIKPPKEKTAKSCRGEAEILSLSLTLSLSLSISLYLSLSLLCSDSLPDFMHDRRGVPSVALPF